MEKEEIHTFCSDGRPGMDGWMDVISARIIFLSLQLGGDLLIVTWPQAASTQCGTAFIADCCSVVAPFFLGINRCYAYRPCMFYDSKTVVG